MKNLMTKHFAKWAKKQNIPENELHKALEEIRSGKFEANLGGHIYKSESGLRAWVKVGVEEQSFATKEEIKRYTSMALRKTKNQIYLPKNL